MTRIACITPVLIILSLAVAPVHAQDHPPVEGEVRVGLLRYAGGRTAACFASGFLDAVARQTDIRVHRQFIPVDLDDDALFRHPFVIFSGEQAFDLSDDEAARLRDYVQRGGFILASAGCSNAAWADSFRALMARLFPDRPLTPLPADHPLMHTLYRIDQPVGRKPFDGHALWHLTLNDRLAVLYSPLGLNDSANAGGGCCCCGGNELRNAAAINANTLVYVLTH